MSARTSRIAATLAVAFALSTLALSACADNDTRAQKIAEKAKERFAAADTNHDGQLSQDEANQGMPRLAAHFAEIDTNKDGQLSVDEIMTYIQQRRGSR
jgi:Ca2+-binding EF-hand superfamily protein